MSVAAASRPSLVGSETPRIWTKPLRPLTPETTLGFEAIDFAENVLGLELLKWQRWFLIHALELKPDGSFRFRTVVLLVGRQSGKALDVRTPMLTPFGWTTMGDLKVGDTVYGADGQPVAVKAVTEVMNDRDCYRVRLVDGREIIADADHQWTVQDTRRGKGRRGENKVHQWETLTTREMVERGVSRVYTRACGRSSAVNHFVLPPQPVVEGVEKQLPIDPYVLGYWLGDGSTNCGQLTIGDSDIDEALGHLNWERTRVRENTGSRPATVSLYGSAQLLRKAGVLGNKHVPDEYMTASVAQRTALLQGLMDSDGYIDGPKGRAEFCGVNRRLVEGVATLARSLGFMVTVREGVATIDGRVIGPKWRACFTPDASGPPPFRLRRKAARVKVRERADRTARIASIEPVESRPVRCIQVDAEDGLYLAGRDLIPTHNTTISQVLTLWRMCVDGAQTVLATAQNLDVANRTVADVQEIAQSNPDLRVLFEKDGRAGGKFWFRLDGAEMRAVTADRKGARSMTADLVFADELREHQSWEAWNAIEATISTRSRGMILAASNAGDSKSVVLRALRDQGIKEIADGTESTLGLFEWSAPEGCDIHDESQWGLALPGLGVTSIVEDVRAAAQRPGNENGFRTERLCQWVEQIAVGAFGETGWRDCLDPGSRIADGSRITLGLDVAYDRSSTALAVAGYRDDGLIHVEVITDRPGTEWVANLLRDELENIGAESVVIQGRGAPASSLRPYLEEAGVPVTLCQDSGLSASSGVIYDAVMAGRLKHLEQPVLDLPAEQAAVKPLGDTWLWDRRNSPVNAAPLCAATFAVWALAQEPQQKKAVSAYVKQGDEDDYRWW